MGLVFKVTLVPGVSLELGGKYVADYRPVTHRLASGPVGFLSWYAAW